MFDAKNFDLGSFDAVLNPHLDLGAFLDREEEEDERCGFLGSILRTELKSLALKRQANALADAEIKSLGLTDEFGPDADFARKVSCRPGLCLRCSHILGFVNRSSSRYQQAPWS